MTLRQLVRAILLGMLTLLFVACAPGVVVPTAAPTLPVSPLPTMAPASTPTDGTPAVFDSPLPTPATPAAGKGVVTGRLIDVATSQGMSNQSLSLASVICPPDVAEEEKRERCVYAVDVAFDPSALTDNSGRFTLPEVTPGDYVVIVGNPEAKHTVLVNTANQPLIWAVTENQVTDLGDLVVDLR